MFAADGRCVINFFHDDRELSDVADGQQILTAARTVFNTCLRNGP